jgi:hypothetical protein
MPFQSEAQRRYLWANEPEIARDWTDTYGSRIDAALGGIMRLGYLHGGVTHPDGRRGFFTGAQADASAGRGAMSPGTGMQGQGRGTGQDAKGDAIRRQNIINVSKIGAPPGMSTSTPPMPTQPKGFWGDLGTGVKNYITGGGMVGMAARGIQGLFTPRTEAQKVQANINKGYDVMNPAEMHGLATRRQPVFPSGGGGDEQQQYPPWWYDNAYAQNIVGDEELDIDTSTGDMEEWIQRFRVKDPYRQDRGALDPQIKEYVSKLYK